MFKVADILECLLQWYSEQNIQKRLYREEIIPETKSLNRGEGLSLDRRDYPCTIMGCRAIDKCVSGRLSRCRHRREVGPLGIPAGRMDTLTME